MQISTTVPVQPVVSYKATLEKLYHLSSSGANKYQTDELNEINALELFSIMETILENTEAAEQRLMAELLQALFSDPERFKSVVAQADRSGVDFLTFISTMST